MVVPASVAVMLISFVSVLREEGCSVDRQRFYANLVVATLPLCGAILNSKRPKELKTVFEELEAWSSRPPSTTTRALCVLPGECPESGPVDEVVAGIAALGAWRDAGFPALSVVYQPVGLFAARLKAGESHLLGAIEVPALAGGFSYPFGRVVESLAPPEGVVSLPSPALTAVEAMVLRSYLRHTISFFHEDRKDAAKKLLAMPLPPGVRYDVLLVDTVVMEALRLPRADCPEVYYPTLIAELCRMQPAVPVALGGILMSAFSRLPAMDTECLFRFGALFAHHLSNFGYMWEWARWEDGVAPGTVTHLFLRDLLERCCRYAYPERIAKSLPEGSPLHTLLPPKAEAVLLTPPASSRAAGHPTGLDTHDRLLAMLTEKRGPEDVGQLVAASGLSQADQVELAFGLFLRAGRKTVTHMHNVMARYRDVIRGLVGDSAPLRARLVALTADFWRNSNQAMLFTVTRMLHLGIVDTVAITTWVFTKGQEARLQDPLPWEVLDLAVQATLARTESARLQVAGDRQALASGRDSAHTADYRLGLSESALATVLGEERQLFLSLFQRLVMVLQAPPPADAGPLWQAMVLGHLLRLGRRNITSIEPFKDTLKSLVFGNPNLPKFIRDTHQSFSGILG
jgi:nuclear cap-binding protein subunit 1